MSEVKTKMDVYEVNYTCSECGAEMEATGKVDRDRDMLPVYWHACARQSCGHCEWLKKSYPYLQYEDIVAQAKVTAPTKEESKNVTKKSRKRSSKG